MLSSVVAGRVLSSSVDMVKNWDYRCEAIQDERSMTLSSERKARILSLQPEESFQARGRWLI